MIFNAEAQVVTVLQDPRKQSPRPQNPTGPGWVPQRPQQRGPARLSPQSPALGPGLLWGSRGAHSTFRSEGAQASSRMLGPHRMERDVALGEEETEGPVGDSETPQQCS